MWRPEGINRTEKESEQEETYKGISYASEPDVVGTFADAK